MLENILFMKDKRENFRLYKKIMKSDFLCNIFLKIGHFERQNGICPSKDIMENELFTKGMLENFLFMKGNMGI